MPSPTEITTAQLSRLIGLPGAPAMVDVRIDEDYAADPRLLPGARRRDFRTAATWIGDYAGQSCRRCLSERDSSSARASPPLCATMG